MSLKLVYDVFEIPCRTDVAALTLIIMEVETLLLCLVMELQI